MKSGARVQHSDARSFEDQTAVQHSLTPITRGQIMLRFSVLSVSSVGLSRLTSEYTCPGSSCWPAWSSTIKSLQHGTVSFTSLFLSLLKVFFPSLHFQYIFLPFKKISKVLSNIALLLLKMKPKALLPSYYFQCVVALSRDLDSLQLTFLTSLEVGSSEAFLGVSFFFPF